jgi:hypothetical protein
MAGMKRTVKEKWRGDKTGLWRQYSAIIVREKMPAAMKGEKFQAPK